MRRALSTALWIGFCWLLGASTAEAGMPYVSLSEVGQLRLQNISFFLMLLLVSALLIKLIWNRLRRDWEWLPELSYTKALGLMVLWGLLFVLVLTMISGARELMTPGAWEKQGLTYRLSPKEPPPANPEGSLLQQRERKLHRLRVQLWKYAQAHDGRFPSYADRVEIPSEVWELPDASEMQYLYVPDLTTKGEKRILAYEPDLFGSQRYVLFTSGDLQLLDTQEITRMLPPEKK
jgi:hypothetical protein